MTGRPFASTPCMLRQVDVLLELEHPCVVSLHEYYVQNGKLHLIMELLPGAGAGAG